MKKLLVAVALALSAIPAFAGNGAPYEQNEIERMLPMLPEFAETTDRVQLAQLGGGSYKSQAGESTESPWANDHNFIAPPQ